MGIGRRFSIASLMDITQPALDAQNHFTMAGQKMARITFWSNNLSALSPGEISTETAGRLSQEFNKQRDEIMASLNKG